MNALQLKETPAGLTVDSRDIAETLCVEHESLQKLIKDHLSAIERHHSPVRFEIGVRSDGKTSGTAPKYCLLTEDQALFIGALCRNTEKVVDFKSRLVTAFQNARRAAQQIKTELTRKELALLIIQAEEELEKAQSVITEQKTKLIEQQPKVAAWQAFLGCDGLIELTSVAQICKTGRNTLYKKLRDEGVFYYKGMYNFVYQQYISAGYFDVKMIPNEKLGPIPVIKCTPKGADWIYNRFYRKEAA